MKQANENKEPKAVVLNFTTAPVLGNFLSVGVFSNHTGEVRDCTFQRETGFAPLDEVFSDLVHATRELEALTESCQIRLIEADDVYSIIQLYEASMNEAGYPVTVTITPQHNTLAVIYKYDDQD